MSALGSLVVKLGLEYAQFTGGLDKSEQAALAHAKRVQDTFDGIKDKVFSVGTAIAGGLAATFTVAAFKGLISDAVATGAALDDLSMQTGATVEALSGLAEVGKFNDMGPEKIGAAMNMLTRNLAGATEESKGTGAAIKALGLDMGAFRAMKPEEQMQAVAKALDGVQDGAGKSAVMMALYGKEGAQMLPFMKDLASVGELQAKVTAEQAAAAAQLDDNWVKLTTTGGETAKEVAMGMVPAFDEAVRAIMDVMSGTGGMRETLRGLVADGTIKQWTTDAITGLSYVADVGQIAWRVLQSIGKGLGGLAAALVQALSGDFRGAWDALKASGQDMIDVFDGPTIGARFRESLGKVSASSDTAGESAKKAAIDFRNLGATADKSAADAEKLATSGADLAASLLAVESGLSGDFAKKWDSLNAAYKAGKLSLDDLTAAQARLLDQQPAMKKATDEAVKASQAAADARRKEADGIAEFMRALEESATAALQSVTDRIADLELEARAADMAREQNISLAEAIERVAIARLQEKQAGFHEGSEGWERIRREIEERERLLGLLGKKGVREREQRGWTDMWTSVDRTAHDVFVNVFEGGSNVFKKLGQTLKASVLDVLYQMTVRKWMINIGTSIFGGGFGAAANAATGGVGGGGGVLGGLGSIGNGFSLLSGMGAFGGGLAGGFGGLMGSLGLSAAGTTLGGAVSAGTIALQAGNIAGGLGTLAGALGPIAIGIALLSSLIKKSTPHTGGAAAYSADMGLVSGFASDPYTGFGIQEKQYREEASKAAGTMAQTIAQTLDNLAKSFGQQGGFTVGTGYFDDSSKDGAWGALRIARGGKTLADWGRGDDRFPGMEFADGEKGTQKFAAAIAKTVKDVIGGMGLPEWAGRLAANMPSTGTMDDLTNVLGAIQAYPAQLLAQYGSDRDTLVQMFAQGLATGDASAAGQTVADALVAGIQNAIYGNAAAQIFDTVNMGIVTPMLDAIATGASVSEALSAASIEATIERAKAQAAAMAELFGNAEFAAALEQMRTAVSAALGGAGALMQSLPHNLQAAQQLEAAADAAADAAEDARKAWQDITDGLLADRFTAEVELLRAMGREEEALAAERLKAIEGFDAYQVSLYDGTQAILAHVAALERQAELQRTLAAELPGVIDQYLSPADRERAQYDRIAADLAKAGLSVSVEALMGASKDDIARYAVAIYNLGSTTDATRLAVLRAAGSLAGMKDAANELALAEQDRARKARMQAQNAADNLVLGLRDGIEASMRETDLGLSITAAEREGVASFVTQIQKAEDALAQIEDLGFADLLGSYADEIQTIVAQLRRTASDQIAADRLLAGDAQGALDARMATRMPSFGGFGSGAGFDAMGWNSRMERERAAQADVLAREASANGLNVRDLGRVLGELQRVAGQAVDAPGLASVRNAHDQYMAAWWGGGASDGTLMDLSRTGLESVKHYWNETAKIVAAQTQDLANPMNAATASIERLRSAAAAFGESASMAVNGVLQAWAITGDESYARRLDAMRAEGSDVRNATLVAAAANVAAQVLTTSTAAQAARELLGSPAFAGMDAARLRDVSMLLDGVSAYSSESFEAAFARINNALGTGKINEAQYTALINTGLDMFEGLAGDANSLGDAFERATKAAGDLADQLLRDAGVNTFGTGETLQEVQRQYEQAFARAQGGDTEAFALFETLVRALTNKDLYSTSMQYEAMFATAIRDLRDLQAMGMGSEDGSGSTGSGVPQRVRLQGVPAFDVGTNYVPYDMLAMVHEGERITPAADNRRLMELLEGGGGNDGEVASLLRLVIDRIERLERSNGTGQAQVKSVMDDVKTHVQQMNVVGVTARIEGVVQTKEVEAG